MGISSVGGQNVIQTLADDRIGIKTNHTRGDVQFTALKSFLKIIPIKGCASWNSPGQNG